MWWFESSSFLSILIFDWFRKKKSEEEKNSIQGKHTVNIFLDFSNCLRRETLDLIVILSLFHGKRFKMWSFLLFYRKVIFKICILAIIVGPVDSFNGSLVKSHRCTVVSVICFWFKKLRFCVRFQWNMGLKLGIFWSSSCWWSSQCDLQRKMLKWHEWQLP